MPPRNAKEPTKNQLRNLGYVHQKEPSFLTAFKAQVANGGIAPPPTSHASTLSSGRAALPSRGEGRQTSEEREELERMQGDEFGWGEGGDDAPLVVVLNEEKHLSREEMEDERRIAKGLAPLHSKPTPPATASSSSRSSTSASGSNPSKPNTSATSTLNKPTATKRKAIAVGQDANTSANTGGGDKKKKPKKEKKGLLSFDEEG